MATGKLGFARSYLRQARVECTNKNWVSQISLRDRPQNPTRLSVRPPGAVSERMLDVLRPRELGPRGHVVSQFSRFLRNGPRENPEVSRQAPFCRRSRRCLKWGRRSLLGDSDTFTLGKHFFTIKFFCESDLRDSNTFVQGSSSRIN
ncbi:hypothetical protein EVAR_90481_1 [Eumeta japonica]|uniref:Uncharacterized protein n=1 Tax=Eumeta variegata TaxID=151549 RepID=A0A4C2AD67_EUMVA|nr:hypothetical protein EVAR_90481_1 [Eumeta japonica]